MLAQRNLPKDAEREVMASAKNNAVIVNESLRICKYAEES